MKEKEEKKYNENGKEVVSPFIYYDNLKVNVDDDVLSNTNRTVYLQSATSPKADNQFIFTPDEYDSVFESNSVVTSFFGSIGPYSSSIDPIDVAKNYMANLTLTLGDRFNSSVSQNLRSIFYNGLFALIKPYININNDNKDYEYLFEDIFKMCWDSRKLFIKANLDGQRINYRHDNYVDLDRYFNTKDANDSAVMFANSLKLHTKFLSDIAKRYDIFISGIATINCSGVFDLDRFAKDMAKDCNVPSGNYEDSPYYSFACSVLHEQADTDMKKISEYLEFEIQHIISLYADHCIDFSAIDMSNMIEDTEPKYINVKTADSSNKESDMLKMKLDNIIHF